MVDDEINNEMDVEDDSENQPTLTRTRWSMPGELRLPSKPPEPKAFLDVMQSSEKKLEGQRYFLEGSEFMVGRAPTKGATQVAIPDPNISANHATLTQKGDRWYCEDLGSTNGTYINGGRIAQSTLIRDGDTLRMGNTTLSARLPDILSRYPYPIAYARKLPEMQVKPHERALAAAHAIEIVLRFVVAAQLGALREFNDDALLQQVGAALCTSNNVRIKKNLSLGDWEAVAYQLASVFPEGARHPIALASESLVTRKGKKNKRSELAELLNEAVGVRNRLVHQQPPIDLATAESALGAALDGLVQGLKPLLTLHLFSVAAVRIRASTFLYTLYSHQGASLIPSTLREELPDRLFSGWCFLLGPDRRPISLAPIVGAGEPEGVDRVNVAMASGIAIARETTEVRLCPLGEVDKELWIELEHEQGFEQIGRAGWGDKDWG